MGNLRTFLDGLFRQWLPPAALLDRVFGHLGCLLRKVDGIFGTLAIIFSVCWRFADTHQKVGDR